MMNAPEFQLNPPLLKHRQALPESVDRLRKLQSGNFFVMCLIHRVKRHAKLVQSAVAQFPCFIFREKGSIGYQLSEKARIPGDFD